MILPMFGLIAVLLVVGGLGTLVAVGDPRHARIAPFLGFVCLAAAVGALLISSIAASLGLLLGSEDMAAWGFFGGYGVGGLAGAAFGLARAFKWRHRIETEVRE